MKQNCNKECHFSSSLVLFYTELENTAPGDSLIPSASTKGKKTSCTMLYVCTLSEELWIYPGSGVWRSKRPISKLRDKWLEYFGEDKMKLQQNKSFWDTKGYSGVVVPGVWGMGEQKASVPVKEHLLFLSLEERRSCHKEWIVTSTYSELDSRSNWIWSKIS